MPDTSTSVKQPAPPIDPTKETARIEPGGEGPIGPDDVISAPGLFLNRPLRREARPGVVFGQAIAGHDPTHLLVGTAGGDDHGVEVVVVPRLE